MAEIFKIVNPITSGGGGEPGSWGSITGTLSNQTDLQNALNAKEDNITNSDDITQGSTNLFLTGAERTKLTNTSGNNTGDQDISGISTNASNISTLDSIKANKSNVLELDNNDAFTPDADYEPATKKYVDDNVSGAAGKWQNNWVTGTSYLVNNAVVNNNKIYKCLEDHTSGTFATDLAANKWELVLEITGGTTPSIGNETASTISNDAITYTAGKRWVVDGDAAIDLVAKVDHTTIPNGGTMEIDYTANGANRVVSYATVFTTNIGTSGTVPSGRTAHYKIKRNDTTYHLLLNDIS